MSGVGKGVTCASIGRLLKSQDLRVSHVKLDPYINVDPGTMNPAQHGEVFVTSDGAETDLDLGHYERFTNENLTQLSNLTSGQVYEDVIRRERRGDYLGGTIQVIPHVTDLIKTRIIEAGETSRANVVVVEVGGTVGDMEGLPFFEALRQLRRELGPDNVMYVHVTFLPHIGPTGELKTKPTQHSVSMLRSIGIMPDVIACRSDVPFEKDTREKIALFCDVNNEAVISLVSVDNIYSVPLILQDEGMGALIAEKLGLDATSADLTEWQAMVNRMSTLDDPVEIAVVGKYVGATDAYISVEQALHHGALAHGRQINIRWIDSEHIEKGEPTSMFDGVDGIVVPGGFGDRGIEGKIATAHHARNAGIPYLGLCLGMQVAVIEYARNVLGLTDANSIEFDPDTTNPVISPMDDHYGGTINMGGTMRLGSHPCAIGQGTIASKAYGDTITQERHRHRMEFNNDYLATLEAHGFIASGINPDRNLVEIIEITNHPWFVGVQFHPEFQSRPNNPHPLFTSFVKASCNPKKALTDEPIIQQTSFS